MNGILAIHKPLHLSSHSVVSRVRGITGIKKVGHAGTLDPLAEGVLPVLLGRATKVCELVQSEDKRYRASMRLGVTTTTYDLEGEVLTDQPVTATAREVEAAAARFVGTYYQKPPMYSALKVNGRKLYDLAREGVEVELEGREITIFSLALSVLDEQAGEYALEVDCSKGTYIRSLIHDIGQALGCGAVLTGLVRTYCAGFSIGDCITLEELSQAVEAGRLPELVLPVERYFSQMPTVTPAAFYARLLSNGCDVELRKLRPAFPPGTEREALLEGRAYPPDSLVKLHFEDGRFMGIGKVVRSGEALCLKLFKSFLE